MFRRTIKPVAPPVAPPPAPPVHDDALRLIPFSPEWSPITAAIEECARPLVCGAQNVLAPDANDLPLILAEADPNSRDVISGLARKWGYAPVATSNGLEAFTAIRAQTGPAVAVINWQMTGMNGIEVCRATRELKHPIYIVLVTERSGIQQLDEALNAGADDYLITPFDADELRARLRVGARVIGLQSQLADALRALEGAPAAP